MRRLIVWTLAVLAVVPAAAAPPQSASDVWRPVAENIEVGARVSVGLRDGRRFTATLLEAGPDGVLLQPRTRVPVPAQRVAYADIALLERDHARGMGAGKAAAIGVASGAGTFLAILLILFAAIGD